MIKIHFKKYFCSIENKIRDKIISHFNPSHFEIIDDSHKHSKGKNSHYRITIVSDIFEGQSPVQKQRSVYTILNEEMQQVHSVSLNCQTLIQYESSSVKRPRNIECSSSKNKS